MSKVNWRIAVAMVACFPVVLAGDVPSSQRSREAIARVRPQLEKALQEKGLQIGSPIFIPDDGGKREKALGLKMAFLLDELERRL